MRIKVFLWLMIVQLILGLSSTSATAAERQNYRLRPGDLVQVSVWGEDKLQKESLVLPDGSITYPLAGRVEVVGLTSTEAENRIAEKLKSYLLDPHVSVVVSSIAGNVAYVVGKVIKPGQVTMVGPITVLDALSVAGGLDKFADSGGIKVIRNTTKGKKAIPIYYDYLIRGERLESNITLSPGDTVVVP